MVTIDLDNWNKKKAKPTGANLLGEARPMEQVLAEKGLNQKVLPSDDGRSESTRNYQCQIEIFKRYLGTRLFNSSPLDLISAHISQSLLIANEISQAQDRLTELLQNVYASYPQYMEVVRMIHSTVDGGEGDVGQRICHPFSQ
ncbi:alpha-glucan water dikinase, partial [Trifolium pratense]